MTGREALEALERVVEARRVALRDNYNFADRPPALSDDCIGISLADLRAALASKDSGPSEQTGPFMTVQVVEWQRLRDLEWWITKHGKPALEAYRDIYGVGTAAINALVKLEAIKP